MKSNEKRTQKKKQKQKQKEGPSGDGARHRRVHRSNGRRRVQFRIAPRRSSRRTGIIIHRFRIPLPSGDQKIFLKKRKKGKRRKEDTWYRSFRFGWFIYRFIIAILHIHVEPKLNGFHKIIKKKKLLTYVCFCFLFMCVCVCVSVCVSICAGYLSQFAAALPRQFRQFHRAFSCLVCVCVCVWVSGSGFCCFGFLGFSFFSHCSCCTSRYYENSTT